jgi:hypothetical protein
MRARELLARLCSPERLAAQREQIYERLSHRGRP